MATVIPNMIRDLRGRETGGVMQSMRRMFLVEGLSSTSSSILKEALEVPGIPVYGEVHASYPNLFVVDRDVEILENSPDKAYVYCEYAPVSRDVFNANEGEFRVTGGTGLIQKRIAYDRNGAQITVSHTFPAGDDDYANETVTQGAEVDVLSPQTTIVMEGIIRTAYPHYISGNSAGYLNAIYWAGGAPYTWMCTDVRWELFQPPDTNSINTLDWFLPRWKFTFEFLYEPETHIPYAIYRDERINLPPPNLVANSGYTAVDWYPVGDFNQLYAV
ncbi:MAG: hypothetical protein IT366_21540 [Candidatus Hydrogenedentes bacterium]|nr:hypothetical protein [Candidatus Hydrogenedentota bacterium]